MFMKCQSLHDPGIWPYSNLYIVKQEISREERAPSAVNKERLILSAITGKFVHLGNFLLDNEMDLL